MTVVEFLEARLAEDEWVARNADIDPGEEARALREVTAHRAIIGSRRQAVAVGQVPAVGVHVLYLLASIYSDHPDFDHAWTTT